MVRDARGRTPARAGAARRGSPWSYRAVAGLLLASASTACAGFPAAQSAETIQVGGLEIASTSAEHQYLVFKTPDDVEKFCLAPPPDAVATYAEGISLGDAGIGVGESAGEGAGILGGRGQAALIVREVLYRTCEISLNYHLEKDEALELYRHTLRAVEAVAKAHLGPGSAPYDAALDLPGDEVAGDEDEDGEDEEDDDVDR